MSDSALLHGPVRPGPPLPQILLSPQSLNVLRIQPEMPTQLSLQNQLSLQTRPERRLRRAPQPQPPPLSLHGENASQG